MPDNNVKKGDCFCEAIQFEVDADEPKAMYLCHCIKCTHASGSAFSAQTWWPRDVCPTCSYNFRNFKITAGEAKLVIYTGEEDTVSGEEAQACTYFCGVCHCKIFTLIKRKPDTFIVSLGNFEDPSCFRPTREVFVKRRCEWLEPIEDAQQFEELSQRR